LCGGRCLTADDFDGDGEVDLAIGSDRDFVTGRVYLRYGDGSLPAGELVTDYPALEQSMPESSFGEQMAAVGDLDGDGLGDLAVTDEWSDLPTSGAGHVWIVLGSTTRWSGNAPLSSAAWFSVEGAQAEGHVGSAVHGLGDVDCDGQDDLAVGATNLAGLYDNTGVVGIWLATTGGTEHVVDATARILGTVGGEQFGSALAHGDLDGDVPWGANNSGRRSPTATSTGTASPTSSSAPTATATRPAASTCSSTHSEPGSAGWPFGAHSHGLDESRGTRGE
jgi:hypothetical protein